MNQVPTIEVKGYETVNFYGSVSARAKYTIRRGNRITETGDGFASEKEALAHAIEVAQGRVA